MAAAGDAGCIDFGRPGRGVRLLRNQGAKSFSDCCGQSRGRRVALAVADARFERMHPRLRELSEHLDRERSLLRDAVASVPVEHHGIQPVGGGWSCLEILEHLAIVERRIGMLLQSKIDEGRAAGLGPDFDESPILPTLGLGHVSDRSAKVAAPEATHPKTVRPIDEIWQSLDASHAQFRDLLVASEGLNLARLEHPHPRFGTLNLYAWFAFVASHEGRHAAQIRETCGSQAVRPS
jgi:hypothetical protein